MTALQTFFVKIYFTHLLLAVKSMKFKNTNVLAVLALSVAAAFLSSRTANAAHTPILLAPASVGSDAYDFGKVSQDSTAQILHKFFLKNANAAPVVLERVQVSCGCTTATLGGEAVLPDTLGPGKALEVDTSIDPLRLYAGPVEKSVAVYLAGQSVPAATLEITGTLAPAASFSPELLNFGEFTKNCR